MAGDAVLELSPKQERAIIALLNEQTLSKAAKAVGVGDRTLHAAAQ